jgi:hypothetical protein
VKLAPDRENVIGSFTDSGQQLGTSGHTDVALGDLDGDDDLDAYVANYDGPCKVWLNQTVDNAPENMYPAPSVEQQQDPPEIDIETIKPAQEEILQTAPYLLLVYPNPSRNTTQIRLKTDRAALTNLKVYNSHGKVVEELFNGETMGEEEYVLIFQAYRHPPGMYILHLNVDHNIAVRE